jgi:hypothetical protein
MAYELESKLAMIKAVQYALNSNSDIITDYPKLIETINTFNEFISKIPAAQKQSDYRITNKSERLNPEEQFSKILLLVAKQLNSFAAMVENVELMTETIALKNNFSKLDKYDLLENGRRIFHYLIENFIYLEHFGIQESTVKEFEQKMRNFDKYLSDQTDNNVRIKYTSDEELSIDEILNFIEDSLDEEVKTLKIRYPKFYNEYTRSRTMKEINGHNNNGDHSYRYFY